LDVYANFASLASAELIDQDYRITRENRFSTAVIVTPHGGAIEPGTSTIVRTAAGSDLSFYLFEGIKKSGGNRSLHITSHRFDEPKCLDIIGQASIVVTVHGCKGPQSRICVGGLDDSLKNLLSNSLKNEGFPVFVDCPEFLANHPSNICNLSSRKCGAQLEISPDLRVDPITDRIAFSIRRAIQDHEKLLLRL
jgi:phage replication-related protein YjqB (UPF0714/DUF867 family)